MKCTIPEISWHNRDPVLSVDIQSKKANEQFIRLASGGTDTHVLIWHLRVESSGVASVECAADLTRHNKPVNVVRFSPSGEYLASGDDESSIIIWKQKTVNDAPDIFSNSDSDEFKEQWLVKRVLRGHLQDVFDISWSPDSKNLVSGSVDNTAVIWDLASGRTLGVLSDHKGFVQGVAWDPCKQYVATISSDRVCRIFSTTTRRIVTRISKARLPGTDPEAKPVHLFHDDTIKTFFRRLTFTPDGELLIVPTGIIEQHEVGEKPLNSTLIFKRNSFTKPVAYLPSLNNFSVAVRCCPVLFKLRPTTENPLFDLQYRVVIAVATQSNVILYDTQHVAPFAFIANIHYTRLTDLTWSQDGKILVVSSTDGYCSIITFADGELGDIYDPEKQSTNIETRNAKLTTETSKKVDSIVKDDQDISKPPSRKADDTETGYKTIATGNESVNKSTVATKDEEEKDKNQSTSDQKSLQITKDDKTFSEHEEKPKALDDLKPLNDPEYAETVTSDKQLTSEKVQETLMDTEEKSDHDSTKTETLLTNKLLSTTHTTSEKGETVSTVSKVGMEPTSIQEKVEDEMKTTITSGSETIDKDRKPLDMEVERQGEVTPTKNSSTPNKDKDDHYGNKTDSTKKLVLEKMDIDDDDDDDVLEVVKCKTDNKNKQNMDADQDFHLHYEDSMTEALKNKNNESSKAESDTRNIESSKKQSESTSFPCPPKPNPTTPGQKTPRRVQLITLSSPKNKKK